MLDVSRPDRTRKVTQMSVCKACNTQNSQESRFCKMCGFELKPAPTIQIKPAEIDSVLTDGYRLLAAGLVEEAEFIANSILELHPESTSALALRAAVYEKQDRLEDAIEYYERVVALNPESTLDRIKLIQLQKRADSIPEPEEIEAKGRNRVAIASAVAAVIVVTGLGVAIAIATAPKKDKETLAATTEVSGFETAPKPDATQPPLPDTTLPPNLVPPYEGTGQISAPDFNPNPSAARNAGSTGNLLAGPAPGTSPVWDLNRASVTPDPAANFGSPGGALPPPNDGWQTQPSNPPANNNGVPTGPDPNFLPPPKPKGKIEITMRGSDASSGGADREGESANIYRVAMEKMRAGDYRGAIRDFQVALNGSSNPAQIHQFLGQCYKALGESGNAKRHYEEAIRLYEAAGNSSAAASCRQALRTLG